MQPTPIDTSRTITYAGSPAKLVVLIVAGAALVALSAYVLMVERESSGRDVPLFIRALGAFGLVFFGFALAVAIARLWNIGSAIVTLSPEGIRDIRIAPEFVPWSAVRNISTWGSSPNQVMVVSVAPEAEDSLTLTEIARWTRRANAKLGADGLCVAQTGLDTGHATLLATANAYWQAFR